MKIKEVMGRLYNLVRVFRKKYVENVHAQVKNWFHLSKCETSLQRIFGGERIHSFGLSGKVNQTAFLNK